MSRPSTDELLPSDAEASPGKPDRLGVARAVRVALRRWRCRVRAYVGTQHVSVELRALTRPLQWRTVRTLHRPVVATTGAALGHALDALGDALQELRHAARDEVGEDFGGTACDVILADAWLLYDVVPVDLAMLSPALAHQAVTAALAEVAGAPAETLSVRWQRRRDGRAVLAMAMHLEDLGLVRRAVTARHLRLAAVTGEFIAIINARRTTVGSGRAVVAVVREAGTQIAALVDGEVALTQFEIGVTDASSLPAVARRLLSARGLDAEAAIDYCIDAVDRSDTAAAGPDDAGRWRWLPTPVWACAA